MIIVLLVPAGLSGVIWASVAAIIVTVAATALPLFMGFVTGQPQTIPVLGNPRLWAHAVSDIATVTGADTGLGLQMSVVIAFALGVPVLAPLFNGMIATRQRGERLAVRPHRRLLACRRRHSSRRNARQRGADAGA